MRRIGVWVLVCVLLSWGRSEAQMLGTFVWQFQPYCNVLTVTVEQRGGAYLLTGADYACGGTTAPAMGVATLNPDGRTVAIGLTIVTAEGTVSQVRATVNLADFSGEWQDQDGNSGRFAYNPGAVFSGTPRPAPRTQVVAGQLTAGAVTPETLAPSVFAGSGVAATAARSDHTHDDRYLPRAEAARSDHVHDDRYLPRTEAARSDHTHDDRYLLRTDAQNTFVPRSAFGRIGYFGQAHVNSNATVRTQRTTNGQSITVSKSSTGHYLVQFHGMGTEVNFDQIVSITPSFVTFGAWKSCAASAFSFAPSIERLTVPVLCVDENHSPVDTAFFITITG